MQTAPLAISLLLLAAVPPGEIGSPPPEVEVAGADAGKDSRYFATIVYEQLMRASAPDLVAAITALGMPG